MSAQWHYRRHDKQVGPISGAELVNLAASGQISPNYLVWREGMAAWAPASSVKGLFKSATPSAALPPPFLASAPPKHAVSFWQNFGTCAVFIGLAFMFIAYLTPWDYYERIADRERKAGRFYMPGDPIQVEGGEQLCVPVEWGWQTGSGLVGFVLAFITSLLIVPPLVAPPIARWAWIAYFVTVLFGLLVLTLSCIWFSQKHFDGIIRYSGPGFWLSVGAGSLLIGGGIIAGLCSLKSFNASLKTI